MNGIYSEGVAKKANRKQIVKKVMNPLTDDFVLIKTYIIDKIPISNPSIMTP
jgi:hypothetical protein